MVRLTPQLSLIFEKVVQQMFFCVCRFLSSNWTIRVGKTTDLLSYGQIAQKVYHLSKFTVFGLFLSPPGLGQLRSNFPFLVVYPFCTRRTLFATFGRDNIMSKWMCMRNFLRKTRINKRAIKSKSEVSWKDKDRSNIVGEDKIVASNTIMLEQNLITREDKNRKQTFEGACTS